MIWNAPKIWEDGECWIIGGGNSLPRQFNVPEDLITRVCEGRVHPNVYSPYLEYLHDKHIIGINNAYQLGTWLDVIFFGDNSWYLVHRINLSKWPGLKVTCSSRFVNKSKENMEGIKCLARDGGQRKGISDDSSKVSWNGNSGAAAISLAVHFGVKRIMLLGFDMETNSRPYTHWHVPHNKGNPRVNFTRHLKGFEQIAKDAEKLGVEILNVNKESKIKEFRKVSMDELNDDFNRA